MITNAKDLTVYPSASGVVIQGSAVINSPRATTPTRRGQDVYRPQIVLGLKSPPLPAWSDNNSGGGGTFDSD
jgi:hypothetical protein